MLLSNLYASIPSTLPLPASVFYEPNYENGPKSVRWQIRLKDEPEFAIAGLWRAWPGETGAEPAPRAMASPVTREHLPTHPPRRAQTIGVGESLQCGRRVPSTPRPIPTRWCLSYALGMRVARGPHPRSAAVPRFPSRIAALFIAVQPVLEGLRDAAPWRPAAPAPTTDAGAPPELSMCRRALVTPTVPQI